LISRLRPNPDTGPRKQPFSHHAAVIPIIKRPPFRDRCAFDITGLLTGAAKIAVLIAPNRRNLLALFRATAQVSANSLSEHTQHSGGNGTFKRL
jgi:hypothetical protein